jgi:alcohol dehydrogenase
VLHHSLLLHAPHHLAWQAEALPPLGPRDKLVRTNAGAVRIGTELPKLEPHAEGKTLITGAGAIGLLTLFNLRANGAHNVDVLEPVAARRALALAFGARNAFDPAAELPAIDSYRYGFECSSRDAAFGLLQAALAREGRICILADGNVEPLTLAPAFHAKELTVVGSSDGLDYQQYALWFWERLRDDIAPLERLFEQQVNAAELPGLFEQMARSQVTPVKVFVRYEEHKA